MCINLNFLFDLNYCNVCINYRFLFNHKKFKDDNIYENHIFNLDFNTAFNSFILDKLDKIIHIQKIKKVKLRNIYTLYRVRLSLENYPNLKYIDMKDCSRLKNLLYMGIPRLFHQNFICIKTNKNLVYLNCDDTDVDTIYINKDLIFLSCNNSDIKSIEFLGKNSKLRYFCR